MAAIYAVVLDRLLTWTGTMFYGGWILGVLIFILLTAGTATSAVKILRYFYRFSQGKILVMKKWPFLVSTLGEEN
jgi:hypothetical protein